MFSEGSATHELIELFFTDRDKFERKKSEASDSVAQYWSCVEPLVSSEFITVKLIEHPIVHPRLPYCGIVDCVGFMKDFGWVVLDWKTSQKRKKVSTSTFILKCI